MRKLIIGLFTAVLFLTGCSHVATGEKKPADMSGYVTYDEQTEYVFDETTVEEVLKRIDNGDDFAVYFGFAACPFCNQAMPVLNEVATDMQQRVDYIDVRSDASWKSNTDIDSYDLLIERIGYMFEEDADGVPHMYVPFVLFVHDGEFVLNHTGVTEDYEVGNDITPAQRDELADIYIEGFEGIQ